MCLPITDLGTTLQFTANLNVFCVFLKTFVSYCVVSAEGSGQSSGGSAVNLLCLIGLTYRRLL